MVYRHSIKVYFDFFIISARKNKHDCADINFSMIETLKTFSAIMNLKSSLLPLSPHPLFIYRENIYYKQKQGKGSV
jgi:hypothetical protein